MRILGCLLFMLCATPLFAKPMLINTAEEEQSYSLGVNIGTQIQKNFEKQSIEVNTDAFLSGLTDAFENKPLQVDALKRQEALKQFQHDLNKKKEKRITKLAQQYHIDLVNEDNIPSQGNAKPKVLLVEFFDYQCPHCKAMEPVVNSFLKNHADVKVLYRELPILGPASRAASANALAAMKQNKYLLVHNALMQAQNPLNPEKIDEITAKLGLNIEQLRKDRANQEIAHFLKQNYALASKIGVHSTPSLFMTTPISTEKSGGYRVIYLPGKATLAALNDAYQTIIKLK